MYKLNAEEMKRLDDEFINGTSKNPNVPVGITGSKSKKKPRA